MAREEEQGDLKTNQCGQGAGQAVSPLRKCGELLRHKTGLPEGARERKNREKGKEGSSAQAFETKRTHVSAVGSCWRLTR